MSLSPDLKNRLRQAASADLPRLIELYKHFHAHPELSHQEEKTGARAAQELSALGLEVVTGLGGHGVVGVLRNGPGPTLLIRGDMDALPVREATGLSWASQVSALNGQGDLVPVMHACGHDLHTTALIGAAGLLLKLKEHWSGTLLALAQPAEEDVDSGARRMMQDGLYDRVPRPDFLLSLHVKPDLAAGRVGLVSGYMTSQSNALEIVVRGVGGHGASPHKAKDPVILAAQIVLALQTIVSREIDPRDMAVVSVGSIHGGLKANIIPEEVRLRLSLRSYDPEVGRHLVLAIERITRGLALAAGLPEDRLPLVTSLGRPSPPIYNDPELVQRLAGVFGDLLGPENVPLDRPLTGSEDFAELAGTEPPIPLAMYSLGATSPERLAEAERTGRPVPLLHNPGFAPDLEPTLTTSITTLAAAGLDLLRKG